MVFVDQIRNNPKFARRQQLLSSENLYKSFILNDLPRMDSNHDKVIQSLLALKVPFTTKAD